MGNDSALDITAIPEASLWAELVRRTQARERTGEPSCWPRVTLNMAMGVPDAPAVDESQEVLVSWSGRRHYQHPKPRTIADGSMQALCNVHTYGKPADVEGVVSWGTRKGHEASRLPMCKSCLKAAVK